MIAQSFAIIAVILVMSFMFLRTGRRAAAIFALPLISVSVFHLLGYAAHWAFVAGGFPARYLHVALDVAGFAAGTVICWILSRAIAVKKLRYVYFFSCVIFLALLSVAYVTKH